MDSFRLEEVFKLWIFVDEVAQMDFVDIGIDGLVSETGPEEHPGQDGESFEAPSEVPELVEEEGDGGEYKNLEGILVAFAAVVVGFEGGEGPEEDVLPVGVEGWPGGG